MTPTRIQLRLQHQAGQYFGSLWAVVTPVAQQAAGQLAADEALTLSLPLPGYQQALPDLYWNGFGWNLRNQTDDVQLFVNEEAVAPGDVKPVVVGDILEVGLCRFLIEAAEPAFTDNNLSGALSRVTTSSRVGHDSIESGLGDQSIGDGDPFQVLPADAMFDQAAASISTSSPVNAEASDEVITQLNEAYFVALRNPDADLRIHAQDEIHGVTALPDVGLDDETLTLEEIISSKLDIDAITERFNDYGVNPLAEPEVYDDVLWLFAPEGQTPTTERKLPPRSRQDHHIMSLDSSYLLATQSEQLSRSGASATHHVSQKS